MLKLFHCRTAFREVVIWKSRSLLHRMRRSGNDGQSLRVGVAAPADKHEKHSNQDREPPQIPIIVIKLNSYHSCALRLNEIRSCPATVNALSISGQATKMWLST